MGKISLALPARPAEVLNKTNTLAGTPEYMAPEVIECPKSYVVW